MERAPYKERIYLAARIVARFCDSMKGILLVGSVAYNPKCVTDRSDLDVILVSSDEDIEEIVKSEFSRDPGIATKIQHRYFDGYRFDENHNGVDVSMHMLRSSVFSSMCSPQIRNLRMYIGKPHKPSYDLFSFDGSVRPYRILPTSKCDGLRVLNVPVFFIEGERCYVGVHADKLLSNPIVIHQEDSFVSDNLNNLWLGTARHLQDQSLRDCDSQIDLSKRSILNALSRKGRFSQETIDFVNGKTRASLTSLTDVPILG